MAFPTGYAPQQGYPTQGPYAPMGQPQMAQPQMVQPQMVQPPMEQSADPKAAQQEGEAPQPSAQPTSLGYPTQMGFNPPGMEPSYYPPPAPGPMYLPPQGPRYPPPFPPLPSSIHESSSSIYSRDDDDENEIDDDCHEIIGITLGGKPCPPKQDPVVCCDCKIHSKPGKLKKCKRMKPKEKPKEGESPCAHTFCIVERAKMKPVGMPWASGLYKYQPPPEEPPKIKVIRKKCKCKCRKQKPVEEESESEEEEDLSSKSSSSSSCSTTKQMKAFMQVFCSLMDMAKKNDKKNCKCASEASSISYCCD